jgi:hypothetical protein
VVTTRGAIEERLSAAAFAPAPTAEADGEGVWWRQARQASKFGLFRTMVALVELEHDDVAAMTTTSRETFARCRAISRHMPRRPNYLVVYVVLLGTRTANTDAFVTQYRPSHWKAREFPVVVDESSGELVLNRRRPIWGAAYYPGHVRNAETLFTTPAE